MMAMEQPVGISEKRTLRIFNVGEPALAKAIADSIARRTNQLQRADGRDPEKRLNDFLEARAEIFRRIYGAAFNATDRLDVVADASSFDMGEEIKIYVEPWRVTLCGKAGPDPHNTGAGKKPVQLHGNIIFRFLDLVEEIDPSQARAECEGCVIEITLPKMQSGVRAA